MFRRLLPLLALAGAFLPFASSAKAEEAAAPRTEILISIEEQRLRVVRGGMAVASFPISSSRFGLGDQFRSYRTPVGVFEVSSKTGENLPVGAVLKGGRFTGEILPPNAPGRDPIVTRILRLRGLEDQNRQAKRRGIFIHGTPEEKNIGKPVSYGCIRMKSRDVVALYQMIPVGTKVIITTKKGRLSLGRGREAREDGRTAWWM